MAARTPKGEKVLEPVRIGAFRNFFEGTPTVQATFKLCAVASRNVSVFDRFITLHEVWASGITAGPANQRAVCAITINFQRHFLRCFSIFIWVPRNYT
jgi:hypothetical protein